MKITSYLFAFILTLSFINTANASETATFGPANKPEAANEQIIQAADKLSEAADTTTAEPVTEELEPQLHLSTRAAEWFKSKSSPEDFPALTIKNIRDMFKRALNRKKTLPELGLPLHDAKDTERPANYFLTRITITKLTNNDDKPNEEEVTGLDDRALLFNTPITGILDVDLLKGQAVERNIVTVSFTPEGEDAQEQTYKQYKSSLTYSAETAGKDENYKFTGTVLRNPLNCGEEIIGLE